MALTELQLRILAVISDKRVAGGESYVAGGSALNFILDRPRLSRDLDLFHDTREALQSSWQADRDALRAAGLVCEPTRELPAFVEAKVGAGDERTLVQWAVDSAFRFFPLVLNDTLGLMLHPFDQATNKVLALVGRVEARDWIDIISCNADIQHLGYLAWAASGKDPGLNPLMILEEARRTARYSREEVEALDFQGPPPDAAALSRQWKRMLAEAREIIEILPVEGVGTCVLDASGSVFRGDSGTLRNELTRGSIVFHHGSIRGAFPAFPGS